MAGQVNDRAHYMEYKNKPIRLTYASWIEATGSVILFDDFIGDTLNTDLWVATETGTGTPWAINSTAGDPVAAHGGWAAATTQNIDAAAEELASMAATTVGNFRPDRAGAGLMVFEARISMPAITTVLINAGFTDDESEGAPLAMSVSGTTWTTTATDGALFVFDTNATTDVFYGMTVDGGSDGTAVAGSAPSATTATILRVEVDSTGSCFFYHDVVGAGTRTYVGSETAVGTSPDVPHLPYLAVASTTTTARSLEVDYVFAACAR